MPKKEEAEDFDIDTAPADDEVDQNICVDKILGCDHEDKGDDKVNIMGLFLTHFILSVSLI